MEVRVWVNAVGVDNLSTLEMPCSPEPCYPPRAGNALRLAVLNESANVHMGFALMWLECVLCLPVCYVPHLSAHALESFVCCTPQKRPLLSTVTLTAGLVEQGGRPFKSLLTQVSKTSSLILPSPHSKVALVTI